jgi:D-glycero-D-manno-heptose 1,7-bisphosphate phosphatase
VSGRRAVFLDRDGTLIVDRHYLADPAGVELLPGAARAVRRLNRAGYLTVVVTNQSGIGRGLFTEADYHAVHGRIAELLAAEGARLDAVYFCPLAPEEPDPGQRRTPGVGMFREAAAELGVDCSASFFVGDRLRDVSPARVLGGTAILLRDDQSAELPPADWPELEVSDSLESAVSVILDRDPS